MDGHPPNAMLTPWYLQVLIHGPWDVHASGEWTVCPSWRIPASPCHLFLGDGHAAAIWQVRPFDFRRGVSGQSIKSEHRKPVSDPCVLLDMSTPVI